MNILAKITLPVMLAALPACLAQSWEIGGMVGGGFASTLPVSTASGSATAGFADGPLLAPYWGRLFLRASAANYGIP